MSASHAVSLNKSLRPSAVWALKSSSGCNDGCFGTDPGGSRTRDLRIKRAGAV